MALPVALLMLRWFPRDVDLASPLYWLTVSAGTAAGAGLAWPLNAWMLSRGYDVWPWPAEQTPVAPAIGPSLPSLRRDWWMLMIAAGAFAVGIAMILS